MLDYMGRPITLGSTVMAGSYGYGTPKGVGRGVVVGFGRVRVRVRWAIYLYAEGTFDTSRPDQLRVV